MFVRVYVCVYAFVWALKSQQELIAELEFNADACSFGIRCYCYLLALHSHLYVRVCMYVHM